MPATEYIYLKGKTSWFRHVKPDDKFGEPKWGHRLYLDNDSLAKVRELLDKGLKNHLKKDDDGYYVSLSRKVNRKTKEGKIIGKEPPLVVDKDGQTPLRNVNIGNGSDVTSKVRCYWYKQPGTGKLGPAIEWESSRIDNLVPFSGNRDFDPEEKEQVKGLSEQSAPLF